MLDFRLVSCITIDNVLLSLTIVCRSFALKVSGSRASLRDNGPGSRFGRALHSTAPAQLPNDFTQGDFHPRLWKA
jgi:hypothetical protein